MPCASRSLRIRSASAQFLSSLAWIRAAISASIASSASAAETPASAPVAIGRVGTPADPFAAERAQAERLARIIVSDIVLYNEEKFTAAVRSGSVLESLRDELDEGRALFRERLGFARIEAIGPENVHSGRRRLCPAYDSEDTGDTRGHTHRLSQACCPYVRLER